MTRIKVPGQVYQKKGTIEKNLSLSPGIFTITYTNIMHRCFSCAKTPMSKILFEMFFGLYFIIITFWCT